MPASSPAAAEEVVGHGHDRAAVDHDLAPAGQPERVLGAGPVEGDGDGGPPVDDDRVGPGVLDVAAADVPGRALLFVDAPEEQGPWAVGQERHPPREGGHVVEVGIPGGDEVVQELFGPLPHGSERGQGVVECGLLSGDLGIGRGSGRAHRGPISAKTRGKAPAQKSPDIPGTVLHLDLSNKPFSWYFAFSSAWTLNL